MSATTSKNITNLNEIDSRLLVTELLKRNVVFILVAVLFLENIALLVRVVK